MRTKKRTASIKSRLIRIQMSTSLLVLGACCIGFIGNEIYAIRKAYKRNLLSTARILEQNLQSSLSFDDKKEAEKVLNSLQGEPNLKSAYLFDNNGKLFARFGDNETNIWPPPHPVKNVDVHYQGNYLTSYSSITRGADRLGTLFLKADAQFLIQEYKNYLWIALIVLITSLSFSIALTNLTHGKLTSPIVELARMAKEISASGNYSLRTHDLESKNLFDEAYTLTFEFNRMLDTIQARTQELNRAQEIALQNAHAAGMADIATGILHNIGNLINSINVSVEQLNSGLAQSKVPNLLKANQLLTENLNRISDFLANDPKGKALPDYYIKLGEMLNNEHAHLREEASSLAQKLVLIKDAVRSQQDLAKKGMFTEEVSLPQLVDEVLNMKKIELNQQGIQVIRQYGEVPVIQVQRVKLAHILVNLIINAKDAMSGTEFSSKRLELEVGLDGDRRVFLRVKDSGVGITDSQMKKIFQHGFTTKKSGHGFGLHFCANAMKEMNGEMSVASPGPGKGAIFTLFFRLSNESIRKAA